MSSITDSYCSTTALFDDQSCVEDSCAEEERRQDVAVLTAEDGLTGNRVEEVCTAKSLLYVSTARLPRVKWVGCGQCRWRQAGVLLLGIFLTLAALTLVMVGAIRSRDHSALKVVHVRHPVDVNFLTEVNFTTAQLLKLTSLAQGKPVVQSSIPTLASEEASSQDVQLQHRTVDGLADTCSETGLEQSPWWRVDLQHSTSVASVRILGGTTSDFRGLQVHVSSEINMPDSDASVHQCRSHGKGQGRAGNDLDLRIVCPSGAVGRFVTIKLHPSRDHASVRLVLCEVLVFSH